MYRLTFRLAIAILTFTIGVVATFQWLIFRPLSPATISVEQNQLLAVQIERRRNYESGMHASGFAGRYRACFGTVTSSDGMSFSWTRISYNSSARARRELQRRLNRAVEIVKREPVFGEAGRQVGEQVVATFVPYRGASVVSAELIWTDGSTFGYVESSSLQNILKYEKDHQR